MTNNITDAHLTAFFSRLIYILTRNKTLCSSLRHLSFQINQRMKGGQEPKGENATQQLVTNWRTVHYSLLLRKLGPRVGAEGSYAIGGPTIQSHEGPHSNLPRKGGIFECKKGIPRTICFDSFHEHGRRKYIHTEHQNTMSYIEIQWNH